jgi:hypothetical protein
MKCVCSVQVPIGPAQGVILWLHFFSLLHKYSLGTLWGCPHAPACLPGSSGGGSPSTLASLHLTGEWQREEGCPSKVLNQTHKKGHIQCGPDGWTRQQLFFHYTMLGGSQESPTIASPHTFLSSAAPVPLPLASAYRCTQSGYLYK